MVLVVNGWCGVVLCFFFFQAEDGIRDLVRSRGLGDVYKRQQERLSTIERRINEGGILIETARGELHGAEEAVVDLSLIHI